VAYFVLAIRGSSGVPPVTGRGRHTGFSCPAASGSEAAEGDDHLAVHVPGALQPDRIADERTK